MMDKEVQEFTYGSFIKKTIDFYINILNFSLQSLKRFWIIPFIIFVGLGSLFFYQFNQTKTHYLAKTSYTFNYVNLKFYGDLLLEVTKTIDNKNISATAETLEITTELADDIISFNAANLMGSPLHEDYTEAHLPFYINVKCKNKNSYKELQKAITKYLTTNSFVINYIEEKNYFENQKLITVNEDIQLIDSLKQKTSVQDADELKTLISLYDAKFEEKKKSLTQLKKSKAVQLLNPFHIEEIPKISLIKKLAIKYFGFGIVLSLITCLLLNWYKSEDYEF